MEMFIRTFERTLIVSVEAAALIGVLLLLTTLLQKKLPPAWLHAIWLLLLAKLMLPWLPRIALPSLYWAKLPSLSDMWFQTQLHVSRSFTANSEINSGDTTSFSPTVDKTTFIQANTQIAAIDDTSSQLLLSIAASIWMLGALIVIASILIGYLKMSFALKVEAEFHVPEALNIRFLQLQKKMGIRMQIQIRLSKQVSAPALFGLFRPTILIPCDLPDQLTDAEWECVLRHELTHLKRLDVQVNVMAALLAAFHWFNPIVWYGLNRMRQQQELACDASVLQAAPIKDAYAACIIRMLEINAKPRAPFASAPFSGYKNQIARRLLMIQSFQTKKKLNSVIGIIVLIATAILTLPSVLAANEASAPPGNISFVVPAAGEISTPFGDRTHPNSSNALPHKGIDITNTEGTAVHASADGTIIKAEYDAASGLTVVVKHNDSWSSEYHHLSQLEVQTGQAVRSSEQIGLMGSTGQSTGTHLHFSIHKNNEYVDPVPLLKN